MKPPTLDLLLEETIKLPRAKIEAHGLTIDTAASDDDLMAIVHRLVAVGRNSQWALATALFELLERRGESWLNQFCIASGVSPKLRRELLAVHNFYPPEKRLLSLTYGHYRDAMHLVSDGKPKPLERALDCLGKAFENDWDVPALRKYAKRTTATEAHSAEERQGDFAAYAAVPAFSRFAKGELPRLSTWTKERIELVLTDLADGLEFVDRLRELAKLKGVRRD